MRLTYEGRVLPALFSIVNVTLWGGLSPFSRSDGWHGSEGGISEEEERERKTGYYLLSIEQTYIFVGGFSLTDGTKEPRINEIPQQISRGCVVTRLRTQEPGTRNQERATSN